MYMQNTLQMEWCLDCHRNPAKNLRPTSQIYNMAWESPSEDRPVWCSVGDQKTGTPTAQSVDCVTKEPQGGPQMALLQAPVAGAAKPLAGDVPSSAIPAPASYQKFTSQDELGHFLLNHYKIRNARDLTSCEVCHR
jgi:hypothetical protein